jgi:hypothetical protein
LANITVVTKYGDSQDKVGKKVKRRKEACEWNKDIYVCIKDLTGRAPAAPNLKPKIMMKMAQRGKERRREGWVNRGGEDVGKRGSTGERRM